ncbi:hypothetical protein [Spongiactinospora sp. TRM90649]|uniref:hypothetical protein n=1 Tax=Spongiactinospora sp. TRM90649 TaxID=3031114 RepID=UPI0023FA2CC8|nr:hypothetical protein [Spongiactinospora sp. TRM90649]MDF5758891.1 hypothetical protein [Spongiactinospora sp. TRM90649]
MFDAVIAGAGPAGMAAALTLGRVHRRVLPFPRPTARPGCGAGRPPRAGGPPGGHPCDRQGYGFRDTGAGGWDWRYIISSFKTYNTCFFTKAYTAENCGGTLKIFYGDVPDVGPEVNDNIRSIIVHA